MKHLKIFSNFAEYNTAKGGLITPNVSFCEEELSIYYENHGDEPTQPTSGDEPTQPTSGVHNGHSYVEIGGVKWATMNVGASDDYSIGKYFQWGDISGYTESQVGTSSGKKYFGWEDYKYNNGSAIEFKKYNSTDGKFILDIEDDAVNANWGGSWRLPTKDEFNKLISSTTYSFQTVNGVYGAMLVDKSNSFNKLFFPNAGWAINGKVEKKTNFGIYFTNEVVVIDGEIKNYVRCFTCATWSYGIDVDDRYNGMTLRGVVGE